jgi:hypothetical protein
LCLVTDATKPIAADKAEALLADWNARGVVLISTDEALARSVGRRLKEPRTA